MLVLIFCVIVIDSAEHGNENGIEIIIDAQFNHRKGFDLLGLKGFVISGRV